MKQIAKKRVLAILLVLTAVFMLLPTAAFATDGSGLEGSDAAQCTKDGNCTAAEHDESCPKYEAKQEEPKCICEDKCTEENKTAECPVCNAESADISACCTGQTEEQKAEKAAIASIQELINALPTEITAENAEAVGKQLDAIDEAKSGLTDEQRAKVDFTAYDAAAAAISALEGQAKAKTPKLAAATTTSQTVTLSNEVQLVFSYNNSNVPEGYAELRKLQGTLGEKVSLTIPDSVKFDGDDTTYKVKVAINSISTSCKNNIESLTFSSGIEEVKGYFNGMTGLTSLTIPGSVKTFDATLQNCKSLTTLIFEEGVEEITSSNMVSKCTVLTTISLPSTLKKLGYAAFSGASALESITLPENVQIPDTSGLFNGCAALKSVELPASVTTLGYNMFNGCTSLESVTAKGTITKVGGYAFKGCTALKTVPELSSVTEMEKGAFKNCKSLTGALDLSSLTSIPEGAFYNYKIDGITLSQSLTSIGESAFESAVFPDGTVLELPDSVTEIGASAFYGTSGLKTVKIGSNVKTIPATAFYSGVEEVIIDNAEENVTWDGVPPFGVKITYLKASIGDVGDKISSEDNAQTLQEAINAARDGTPTTITISKDVKIKTGLTVPANKNITIESAEGGSYIIIANGKAEPAVDSLFTVAEGASVTFQNVTLSGAGNSGSIVSTHGAVTLGSGAVAQYGKGNSQSGVIAASGSSASVTINGGSVQDNLITDQYSGAVYASDGATVNMTGGTITGNKVTNTNAFNSSSGIMLKDGATGTMSGGSITGNSAIRGSAVMVYSTGDGRSTFALTGGEISGNRCKSSETGTGALEGSGAVHVEGNAAFTMTGGSISNNTGVKGAGVCVVDPGLQQGSAESQTAFTMNGGTISGNSGGTGGGVYSYSNYVNLNAGTISSNSASMGGGVYSEGNADHYSTLHMSNVVITSNTSNKQGGGLWLCPTGDAQNYVNDGGAIYDNTAAGAGADVVSATGNQYGKTLTLADRMLGGGKVEWYADGAIYVPSGFTLPSADSGTQRYPNTAAAPVSVKNDGSNLALKAVTTEDAKTLANAKATLVISGNTAADYGGGVAANGGVVIGTDNANLKSVSATKSWVHNGNADTPESVTVKLVRTEGDKRYVLETATLSNANGWKYIFEGLPTDGSYTVAEEAVEGYATVISGSEKSGYTITNTFEVGKLTVSKTVTGDGAEKTKEFSFTLTLTGANGKPLSGTYGNLTVKDGSASFKLKDGESITITNLPAGAAYSVTEVRTEYYTSASTGASGEIAADETAEAEFTNTHVPMVDITVNKVWSDNGNKLGARPGYVTMQLYKDGETYGEAVTIDASDGWTYTWTDLIDDGEYTVKELNVPKGYYALTKQRGDVVTITNCYGVKTGDESNLALWLALAGASLAGAAVAVIITRKKRGTAK